MRRQIIVMFCGLFLLPLPAAFAEAPPAAVNRGALFKVQDASHTLYLFGTIHVGAPDFYPLEPTVTRALHEAGALALEIDPTADPRLAASAVLKYGMDAPGSQAACRLPPGAGAARIAAVAEIRHSRRGGGADEAVDAGQRAGHQRIFHPRLPRRPGRRQLSGAAGETAPHPGAGTRIDGKPAGAVRRHGARPTNAASWKTASSRSKTRIKRKKRAKSPTPGARPTPPPSSAWPPKPPPTPPSPPASCRKCCSTAATRNSPTASPRLLKQEKPAWPPSACCTWSASKACRTCCARRA